MDISIYRDIIEQSTDAVLFADRSGIIRIWNAGAEVIFGYSAAEALGMSLDIIIPEKLRQRHWEGYHRVMDSGIAHYGSELLSVPATHKDGRRIFSDFSIVMVKNAEEQLQGIASIMRDTTEQKTKEKDLKDRLKALGETA